MKQFAFDDYSKTIRLLPENYCIAARRHETSGDWQTDIDAAVPLRVACAIFVVLREHSIAWSNDPSVVVNALNKNITYIFK